MFFKKVRAIVKMAFSYIFIGIFPAYYGLGYVASPSPADPSLGHILFAIIYFVIVILSSFYMGKKENKDLINLVVYLATMVFVMQILNYYKIDLNIFSLFLIPLWIIITLPSYLLTSGLYTWENKEMFIQIATLIIVMVIPYYCGWFIERKRIK